MDIHFTGIIIAAAAFAATGLFHPLVVKTEYYFGTGLWWVFLVLGAGLCAASLFASNVILSSVAGVLGACCLWSIGELFHQKRRVEKGWFPMNPKRRHLYSVTKGK